MIWLLILANQIDSVSVLDGGNPFRQFGIAKWACLESPIHPPTIHLMRRRMWMFNAGLRWQKANLMWSRWVRSHLATSFRDSRRVVSFLCYSPLYYQDIVILRGGVDDNNNNSNEQGQENTPNLYKFPTLSLQNILDKFNPGARQLISAGKTYLKALHGKKTLAMLFIYSCSFLSYGIILL